MKYIDAEKLKADIKGLQCEQGFEDGMEERGYQFAIMDVLDIITSLQQEQQEVELELEKDIQECWRNWLSPSNQNSVEGMLPKEEFAFYARHFYSLGLNARKE